MSQGMYFLIGKLMFFCVEMCEKWFWFYDKALCFMFLLLCHPHIISCPRRITLTLLAIGKLWIELFAMLFDV